MDAFPGYTYFNPTKKVLCAIQIVEDAMAGSTATRTVFPHEDDELIEESRGGDSVDEDNLPFEKIDESIMSIPSQTVKFLEKPISEMVSEDTYVGANGSVYGTLKYITDFEAFNSTNVAEQSGYYFPFNLNKSGTKMTFKKNGVVTKKGLDYDPEILFRVTSPNTIWEVYLDEDTVPAVKLNFRTANFEK